MRSVPEASSFPRPCSIRERDRSPSEKVAVVQEWPTPRGLTDVRSFLGLCSYYRRFIPGFADVAAPLHALQRKNVPFVDR